MVEAWGLSVEIEGLAVEKACLITDILLTNIMHKATAPNSVPVSALSATATFPSRSPLRNQAASAQCSAARVQERHGVSKVATAFYKVWIDYIL
jgi:hypothetical protein